MSVCAAAATRRSPRAGTLTLPAKKLFEIVKRAARHGDSHRGGQGRQERDGGGRSVRVADADAAGERISDAARSDGGRPERRRCRARALKRMISHTRFAITSEDTRYFLNGAQLVLRPESMSMVATDGHRLAFITRARVARARRAKTEVLLPRKTLNEVGAADRRRRRRVEFSQGENHLFFQAGGRLLISRKIDANFPAYERVIPKTNDKRDRIRSRSAGGRGPARPAALERAVEGREVRRSARTRSKSRRARPEVGEAHEVLPVDYSGGGDADLLQRRLRRQLPRASSRPSSVELEFKDEMSQAVMKPIGAEGYDYTYVIMPMRI